VSLSARFYPEPEMSHLGQEIAGGLGVFFFGWPSDALESNRLRLPLEALVLV